MQGQEGKMELEHVVPVITQQEIPAEEAKRSYARQVTSPLGVSQALITPHFL